MLSIQSKLSPHFNERPAGQAIDTIIVHSMYAKDGADCFDPASCIDRLNENQVSAHYVISLDGNIWQLVEESKRAWHAGVSKMPTPGDSRDNVNNFSIGIELIGPNGATFPDIQYKQLAALTKGIIARHSIRNILGHEHIAPGRKVDPGAAFDWERYKNLLQEEGVDVRNIYFPAHS